MSLIITEGSEETTKGLLKSVVYTYGDLTKNKHVISRNSPEFQERLSAMYKSMKIGNLDIKEMMKNQKFAYNLTEFEIHNLIAKVEMEDVECKAQEKFQIKNSLRSQNIETTGDYFNKRLKEIENKNKKILERLKQRCLNRLKREENFDPAKIKFELVPPDKQTKAYPYYDYKKNRGRIIKAANTAYVEKYCGDNDENMKYYGALPQNNVFKPNPVEIPQTKQNSPPPKPEVPNLEIPSKENSFDEQEDEEIKELRKKWESGAKCLKFLRKLRKFIKVEGNDAKKDNAAALSSSMILKPKADISIDFSDRGTSMTEIRNEQSPEISFLDRSNDINRSTENKQKVELNQSQDLTEESPSEKSPNLKKRYTDAGGNSFTASNRDRDALNRKNFTIINKIKESSKNLQTPVSEASSETTEKSKINAMDAADIDLKGKITSVRQHQGRVVSNEKETNIPSLADTSRLSGPLIPGPELTDSPKASVRLPNIVNSSHPEDIPKSTVESFAKKGTGPTRVNPAPSTRNSFDASSLRPSNLTRYSQRFSVFSSENHFFNNNLRRRTTLGRSVEMSRFHQEKDKVKSFLNVINSIGAENKKDEKDMEVETTKQAMRYEKMGCLLEDFRDLSYMEGPVLHSIYQYKRGDKIHMTHEKEGMIARFKEEQKHLDFKVVKIKKKALKNQLRDVMDRKRLLKYDRFYN